MSTTSIKVPVELRDRLSAVARRQRVTLAAAISHALDVAETAEFWDRVRTSMPAAAANPAETDELSRTVSDGIEPEDWTDVL